MGLVFHVRMDCCGCFCLILIGKLVLGLGLEKLFTKNGVTILLLFKFSNNRGTKEVIVSTPIDSN